MFLGQVQIRCGRIPLNDGDVALQVRFGNRGSGATRFHLGVFHLLISRAQGIFLFQQGLQSAVVSLLLHLFVGPRRFHVFGFGFPQRSLGSADFLVHALIQGAFRILIVLGSLVDAVLLGDAAFVQLRLLASQLRIRLGTVQLCQQLTLVHPVPRLHVESLYFRVQRGEQGHSLGAFQRAGHADGFGDVLPDDGGHVPAIDSRWVVFGSPQAHHCRNAKPGNSQDGYRAHSNDDFLFSSPFAPGLFVSQLRFFLCFPPFFRGLQSFGGLFHAVPSRGGGDGRVLEGSEHRFVAHKLLLISKTHLKNYKLPKALLPCEERKIQENQSEVGGFVTPRTHRSHPSG